MDHTPEDVGSKPTTGIIQFAGFAEAGRHSSSDVKTRATRIHIHIHIFTFTTTFTCVAQRKRAVKTPSFEPSTSQV